MQPYCRYGTSGRLLPSLATETKPVQDQCQCVSSSQCQCELAISLYISNSSIILFTARCDANAVFAVTQCLSVTFVDHVKTNKDIFEIFSPTDSDTILVFPSQRGCRYSDGNPPNGGVGCKGDMIK